MEELRNLGEITEPDERHGQLNALTGRRLILESLYAAIRFLCTSVPPDVWYYEVNFTAEWFHAHMAFCLTILFWVELYDF